MQRLAETLLPTRFGTFQMIAYPSGFDTFPHVALFNGALAEDQTYDVRIHSECMTGDVFSSVRCECGEQLDFALDYIARCGGVVVYLRQEGRGIGLVNKMHAYNLQDAGFNTREANLHLGFHADPRDYTEAIAILHDLGIRRLRLMTNNPSKLASFDGTGVEVVDRLPIEIPPRAENIGYLRTKKEEMGHLLALGKSNGHARSTHPPTLDAADECKRL